MKTGKLLLALLLAMALLCSATLGVAETATVVTPKGPLNVRKTPDKNAKVIGTLANHSQVEVESVDGDWATISYKDKTAYVMVSFLRLPSDLAGQKIYANGGELVMLREAPDAASAAVYPLGGLDAVTVESVEDGWMQVTLGDLSAYVEADHFSFQNAEPVDKPEWINEPAEIAAPCVATLDAQNVTELAPGDAVTVTLISGDKCLVITEAGCGYVPVSAVHLLGPAQDSGSVGKITPMAAYNNAISMLKKSYKGFSNQYLKEQTRVYSEDTPLYHCGFFNEKGQYLYGALVNANSGKVVYHARYSAFAAEGYVAPTATPEPTATPAPTETPALTEAPAPAATPTPAVAKVTPGRATVMVQMFTPGAPLTPAPTAEPSATEAPATEAPATEAPATEAPATEAPATEAPATEAPATATPEPEKAKDIELSITANTIELGDVLDIVVNAWTDYSCEYTIYSAKGVAAEMGSTGHFSAAYRPHAAGEYMLKVTVRDEEGVKDSLMIGFKVQDAETEGVLYDLYSQKDGWWKESGLENVGDVVFTLTHAMEYLGIDTVEMLPENLAVIYSSLLLPGAVEGDKLFTQAAKDFGFTAESEPVKDADKIKSLLKDGAVFACSPVSGHTALACGVSEDGAMVRIVDSAPYQTFTALGDEKMYLMREDGSFQPLDSIEDHPECRWYLETDDYGALEYWLRLDYVADCNCRAMQAKKK